MEGTSASFKENAQKALVDPLVVRSRGHIKAGFIGKRRKAADRLPEFEVLRTNRLDGLFWATPAIAGDSLLLREAGSLYCVRE